MHSKSCRVRGNRGFTLIELLTVIGLLGVLTYLSLANFDLYRSTAAYGSVESTLHSARTAAESSQVDPAHLPPFVAAFQQSQGGMTDAGAREYLPGLKIPAKTRIFAMYDPGCGGMACVADFIQVAHCQAREHALWVRWGDGFEFTFRNLPGGGGWC